MARPVGDPNTMVISCGQMQRGWVRYVTCAGGVVPFDLPSTFVSSLHHVGGAGFDLDSVSEGKIGFALRHSGDNAIYGDTNVLSE